MRRYFILGTDTGIGKTYVTCCLLDFFNHTTKKTIAIKPIVSGGEFINGAWVFDDIVKLNQHQPHFPKSISGWQFPLPISPHLAAQKENVSIDIQQLQKFCYSSYFEDADLLFIEGAGGLMVPLNEKETWLDFLIETKIPVILVVGLRLGCI